MNFFKKHGDAVVVILTLLGAMAGSMVYINGEFREVRKEISNLDRDLRNDITRVRNEISCVEKEIRKDIANLDKEIAIIKTVMIMKNIMPSEVPVTSIDTSTEKMLISPTSTPKPASSSESLLIDNRYDTWSPSSVSNPESVENIHFCS